MVKNIFLKLWTNAPLSWAIIRARECELLAEQHYKSPVLEIGCGDGLATSIIFSGKPNSVDVGIDIDSEELMRAKKTRMYKKLLAVDITKNSFKSKTFNTAFSNGVLEHIPDLNAAMEEIARVLKPGGTLITTSPTDNYTKLLFYYRLLSVIGLKPLALLYERNINKVFAHRHLLSQKQWEKLGLKHGLKLERYTHYNNDLVTMLHDVFLPLSLTSKYVKRETDSMVLFKTVRKMLIFPFVKIFENIIHIKKTEKNNASIFLVFRKI